MPRQPRIDVGGVAQHVVRRGNDRQPCFVRDVDRVRYLDTLTELCVKAGCRVHAYDLMTNHVHLLITPSAAGQVACLLQALGRRYVRYVDDAYCRTATLWEGRYKAYLVEGDAIATSSSTRRVLLRSRARTITHGPALRTTRRGRQIA